MVIPTRNRADLAINAVRSVLDQKDVHADIVVSDNSTDEEELSKLEEFCLGLDNPLVRYVRPDEPLPMPAHWSWALDRAFSLSSADHVIYLTDRMVLIPTALRDITAILDLYPEKVISYGWDLIRDIEVPLVSFQVIRTGKVYEIASQDLMDRASESAFNFSLPRMMNSCCTRKTIERIKKKFGKIFFTDVPDFNFAYSCLEVEDSVIYYDYPLLISYGIGVSTGSTFNRGLFNESRTTKDFIKTTHFTDISDLVSRLPLSTTKHIAFEYALIRKDSDNKNLKELDEDKLLRRVLKLVIFYEDKAEKKKALREIYAINKIKFPVHLAYTYFSAYKERGLNKLKSRLGSHDAFDIMKHHRTLEDAMSEIINTPRPPTSGRAFFEERMGRFPRELEVRFKSPGGDAG